MKKYLLSIALMATTVASACWFTELNFNRHYIARVNNKVTFPANAVWTGQAIVCEAAGKQNLPAQIWIKLQPRSEAGAPKITEAILQYKKLPSGNWITFKTLKNVNWDIEYHRPVQLFGPNVFDPPGAVEDDEYLVRLWFSDGLYENADLSIDTPEGGNLLWRNQWVTKIIIGKRRPI